MHLDAKDILTLIGIGVTLVISLLSLFVGIRNSRKTIFINSITSSRIKYIQDIRNGISEFCGLVYAYHGNGLKTGSTEAFEIQKRYDNLKYLIQLHFNVEDEYFDPKIIDMIKEIRDIKDGTQIGEVEKAIGPLILIMQYLLKFEWEGAKLESRSGYVSPKTRDKLYQKYVKLYEERQLSEMQKNNDI